MCELLTEKLIGNTLEETAYHEAAHMVIAAAAGLDLKPGGITIWEAAKNVMDGLARYWDDELDWGKNLLPLRAGQLEQWRRFPNSCFLGSRPDDTNFSEIVNQHLGPGHGGIMRERVTEQVTGLLDRYADAIVAVAEALIQGAWIPVETSEHCIATRKKHLDGNAIAAILAKYGIRPQVRP